MELGVDAIENDVHLTKDDQLIIIHDEVLERTTNSTKSESFTKVLILLNPFFSGS